MKRKKRITDTKWIVIMILAIYIITLSGGIFFISYANSGMHKTNRILQAKHFADIYNEHGSIDIANMGGVGAVFDSDGAVIYRFGRESFFKMKNDIVEEAKPYLQRLAKKDYVFFLDWFAPNGSTLGFTSLIYSIVKVADSDKALVFINEAPDFLEILIGYISIITVVFIVLMIIMVVHSKMFIAYEKAQKIYIDNVTHELKTPVTSVKALAVALSDDMDKNPADRNIYYGMILKEASKQERMINDILQLSKLQGGYGIYKKRVIKAEEIFSQCKERYESLGDLLEIEIVQDDSLERLPDLYTDKAALENLIEIFMENAMKFSRDGGKIHISCSTNRRKVVIGIEDNGIGISKEDITKVGNRFFRGSNAQTFHGSGIGLAIAKEITKALKEKMWIESEVGVGTKVFFTVSLRK